MPTIVCYYDTIRRNDYELKAMARMTLAYRPSPGGPWFCVSSSAGAKWIDWPESSAACAAETSREVPDPCRLPSPLHHATLQRLRGLSQNRQQSAISANHSRVADKPLPSARLEDDVWASRCDSSRFAAAHVDAGTVYLCPELGSGRPVVHFCRFSNVFHRPRSRCATLHNSPREQQVETRTSIASVHPACRGLTQLTS